jgi:hypothetical protein
MAFGAFILAPLPLIVLCLFAYIIKLVLDSRKAGLSHVPGPWLAKYTDGWKFFQACVGFGKKELLSAKLMEKYGDVVRTGPTSVAVFDHNAVTTVLGAGTRYDKVIRLLQATHQLPVSLSGKLTTITSSLRVTCPSAHPVSTQSWFPSSKKTDTPNTDDQWPTRTPFLHSKATSHTSTAPSAFSSVNSTSMPRPRR